MIIRNIQTWTGNIIASSKLRMSATRVTFVVDILDAGAVISSVHRNRIIAISHPGSTTCFTCLGTSCPFRPKSPVTMFWRKQNSQFNCVLLSSTVLVHWSVTVTCTRLRSLGCVDCYCSEMLLSASLVISLVAVHFLGKINNFGLMLPINIIRSEVRR